jgi:hypothetical protein
MLLTRKLRLTTPLLAVKRERDACTGEFRRVFARLPVPRGEPADRVYLPSPLARWQWAFLEARDALDLKDAAVSAILPAPWYSASATSVYNRRHRNGEKKIVEKFESLQSGQVIEARFTLSRYIPPDTDGLGRFSRAPDEQEFDDMLIYIGENLGISEWGHAYLHGRFKIQDTRDDNK